MLKFIPVTALVLGLSGGVALADRGHRDVTVEHHNTSGRDHRGSYGGGRVVFRNDHNWRGGWNHGGSRVIVRNDNYRHIVRRPIYISRPVIRERYYNYYRRPSLIVENYNTTPGYYWVAGSWSWNGGEWIWQPGHYQPDPNYIEQGYDQGYDQSYDQGSDPAYDNTY